MNKLLLLLSMLLAAGASSDDQKVASQTDGQISADLSEEIYVFRVYLTQEPRAQARFTGQYEIVNGCLAFRGGGQLYLPAMSASAKVSISENEINLGNRVVKLGVDTLIVGGVFQGDLAALSSSLPPADCRWPVII